MSRSAGALLDGLAGGVRSGEDMKRRRLDAERRDDEWRDWRAEQRYLPRGSSDGYYAPETWRPEEMGHDAGGYSGHEPGPGYQPSSGKPALIKTDPVSTDMPRHRRAFLNAVAVGESAGAYDVRYTPRGGERFAMDGKHPRIFEPGPHGPSSAAGRYQFTATTWDRMGGGEFSPKRQDRQAWQLAVQDYRARTGRDLDQDLMRDGMTPSIVKALSPTWAAFKGKPDRFIDVYNNSYSRFTDEARSRNSSPRKPEPDAAGDTQAETEAPTRFPSLAETMGKTPKREEDVLGLDPLLLLIAKHNNGGPQ